MRGSALALLLALSLAAPASAADETRNMLVDPQHHNVVADSPLQPPLKLRWQANLGWVTQNVVVTGGRVFYIRYDGQRHHVTALDAADGHVLWNREVTGAGGVAFDDGRLYYTASSREPEVHVAALDPQTGAEHWHRTFTSGTDYASPPTVSGGQLFFVGSGAGRLYALRQSDGADLWSPKTLYEGSSARSPALDDERVYISDGWTKTYAFDRFTGEERWQVEGPLHARPAAPVLDGERLYVTDANVYHAADGRVLGEWHAWRPPTITGPGAGVEWANGIRAFGPSYDTTRWLYEIETGFVFTSPLVAGDHVYSQAGQSYWPRAVMALRLGDGALAWCMNLTLPPGSDSSDVVGVRAAGSGLLLVSLGSGLFAFESGGTPSDCSSSASVSPDGNGPPPSPPLPDARAGGLSLAIEVRRRRLRVGRRTTVAGSLAGATEPSGVPVALEIDRWPFDGGFRVAARTRTDDDGGFRFRVRPRRNARLRAVLERDPAVTSTPVDVFADFPFRVRRLGGGGARPRLRVTVRAPRRAAVRRRMVYAYLLRPRSQAWRRVAASRWKRRSRRSAAVTLRYPRGSLGRRDHWLVCAPERLPDAWGRPSEVERRCGARTLPRSLSP